MARTKQGATGLVDINFAYQGEQIEDSPILINEDPIVQSTNNYVLFKLIDTKKKGGTYVPNVDDVVNPATGKIERIRLLTGIDTIWMKEQKDVDSDYIRQNARSLQFPRGMKVLRIDKTDMAALEFARLTRHNVKGKNGFSGSKFGFYEYDAVKEAEAALGKEMLELEMVGEASKLSDDMVKKYMAFLKLPIYDPISGEIKAPQLLRKDLMLYAKRNATEFAKLVKERTKEVELSSLISKCILEAKIDISSQVGRAFWANGGGLIGIVPATGKPVEYLTQLAMTNSEEGRLFLDQLNNSK